MDNTLETASDAKVLTDDEIRALFESSVLGLANPGKAVPKDELYATLIDLASNPEREHLLPMFLTVFKRLYVDEMFIDQGLSGWKIDLAKNELVQGRDNSFQLVQPQTLVTQFSRQKDKMNENQFIFI